MDIKDCFSYKPQSVLDKANKLPAVDEFIDEGKPLVVKDGKFRVGEFPVADIELSEYSNNAVANSAVTSALSGKQDTLVYDTEPTAESNNSLTSGAVYSAVSGKQDALTEETVVEDTVAEAVGFNEAGLLVRGNLPSSGTSLYRHDITFTLDTTKEYKFSLVTNSSTALSLEQGFNVVPVGAGEFSLEESNELSEYGVCTRLSTGDNSLIYKGIIISTADSSLVASSSLALSDITDFVDSVTLL